ncbi:class I SAM-dependent methyltransferase [Sphingomonas sp. UNC305MFCol5.2]|uniref:class I SAM-dependent methyltransferase n=1 Tax=Sphingomonas sp. UNC305MFCol5.2 TaxID=1449076 RepID=UPI000691C896|nr:class I SAM-dependent methyltransferase [Sphingomonas sp. UNC305MFCol5.2]
MSALPVREGYRLWAPTYNAENAVSQLEASLVAEMTPPLAGLRLLDAGCGTGRRLRDCGAAMATGVDLSPEMIAAGQGDLDPAIRLLVGDVRALPLPDAGFDLVWCRLVIGHLSECARAYAELGRVTARGGQVIVTDFHPAAHAAGHRRTFRHGDQVHEVEHHVHELAIHREAARAAGLRLAAVRAAEVGPSVRPFYERAGRIAQYEADRGLPVVLALSFVKEDRCGS